MILTVYSLFQKGPILLNLLGGQFRLDKFSTNDGKLASLKMV